MNDKELIKSWTVDLTDYQRDMLEDMMQKARQDEREKLEAENAGLRKEMHENMRCFDKVDLEYSKLLEEKRKGWPKATLISKGTFTVCDGDTFYKCISFFDAVTERDQTRIEITELKSRWERLKTVISNMIKARNDAMKNNDIYRLSACELNDDFIDMLEKLMQELEKEKGGELKGGIKSRESPNVGNGDGHPQSTPKPKKECDGG